MSDIVERLRACIVERLRACAEHKAMWSTGLANQAADTITRLTEERDALADDRDGYVQLLTDQNTRLTAEVAEYEATFDAAWEADMAGVQMWREAHPGNDLVLPDRKRFTAWILAEIVVQRAGNEQLRAALEGIRARRYQNRETVSPENAFEAFGRLNAEVCAIYAECDAALKENSDG
jgi:hypothetical protein